MREHNETYFSCVRVYLCICVRGEHGAQATEPFKNTINRMNHLLRQLRRQQRDYSSSHSFCIMSKAARGTPLTILMMLAAAINDAVTELWLDFKKIVVMVAGRGSWGHNLVSPLNRCAPPGDLHGNTRGE